MCARSSRPRWRAERIAALACLLLWGAPPPASHGQAPDRVVDLPTRPGVTQRFLLLEPREPRAAVILFAGGHGGLQIADDGRLRWGAGNFLVRSRHLFAEHDLMVAVVDSPSDRQSPPHLSGHRQTREHVADVKTVIVWLRGHGKVPVWLVGTSRGTQSAAFLATQLRDADAPDGIVLTATILRDDRGRPVPDMELGKLTMPVLVVHHEQDGCRLCLFKDVPRLMDKLAAPPRKELMAFTGGENRGDPCEAFAHHGFNGLERQVVARIAGWILAK
jgi:dienelactone hydrolase